MSNPPELYGLVLAGGKSTRMGEDKGLLDYHHMPQREYVLQALKQCCQSAFISCTRDQAITVPHKNVIIDTFDINSPLNGILSAFKYNEDVAWLIVACDMPFINIDSLKQLIQKRDRNALATVYLDTEGIRPDPMLAIWEPKAYPLLLEFTKAGQKSPRAFLTHHPAAVLRCPNPNILHNVNTKEAFKSIKKRLK